jgi:hypothetical protein
MYLAAADLAVSSVLMVERGQVQTPIYYVSRVLSGPEVRYSAMEKLTLSLVHATRRLRRYFQAHTVEVQTSFPIQQVLRRPELSIRLAKWAVELNAFVITYKPRTATKGQIIADFIAEVPEGKEKELKEYETELNQGSKSTEVWTLHTDGASNEEGNGAGLILDGPDGVELTYALKLSFKTSNNEAEYEALIAGLRMAHQMGIRHLQVFMDSMLVVNQINHPCRPTLRGC